MEDGKIKGWPVKSFDVATRTWKMGRVNFRRGKTIAALAIMDTWMASEGFEPGSQFRLDELSRWRKRSLECQTSDDALSRAGERSGFTELRVVVYRVPVSPCHVEAKGNDHGAFSASIVSHNF